MLSTWGRPVQALRVFISSPDNVHEERDIVLDVIAELNSTVARGLDLVLDVIAWENWTPGVGPPEDHIRQQIKDCDLLILLMADRFGRPPSLGSQFESGTQMEYEEAMEMRRRSQTPGRPEVFTYFQQLAASQLRDPGEHLKKVLEFRNKVGAETLSQEYRAADASFQRMVRANLVEWLQTTNSRIERPLKADERAPILRRLFDLGAGRGKRPWAVIVFPPLTEGPPVDTTHLLPYMVLEDFQAVDKLARCLAWAGSERTRCITCERYNKDEYRAYNKVFLCLPRNEKAQRCLRELISEGQKDARFKPRFQLGQEPDSDGVPVRHILWQSGDATIRVRSPQSLYLRAQREGVSSWMTEPGRSVAVDFAILARFENPANEEYFYRYGKLSKTFLFGIRGLGTWGAAWYLLRRAKEIEKGLVEGQPFQALLRVEYEDYRIKGVEDVSDRDQEFFDQEMDMTNVLRRLDKYRGTWSSSVQDELEIEPLTTG